MATTRTLSPGSLISTIYATDLRRLVFARKTLVLFCVQLLPVIFASIYVFTQNVDSLSMFSDTVEGVVFYFLIPLAAIFYGGPVLVDEMEGRTLTYLTLRPVPKPVLYLGKWLAATTVAVGLVLIPMIALLIIVLLASGGEVGMSLTTSFQIFFASIAGMACFTAIFAALGALAGKSLFAGVLYFVIFEIIFAALPLLEWLSVGFHMRYAAGFSASKRIEALERIGLAEAVSVDWKMGSLLLILICAAALFAGAMTFRNKQYHV